MRKKMICKMTALLLIAAMCVGVCTGFTVNAGAAENSASDLRAPSIVEDSGMEAKQKVTWDCVWFGNYPQSEVESSDAIYKTLQDADGWDGNNDITIGGNRYRRMKKGDATCARTVSEEYYGCYNWSDEDTYHYFKYEPVKWRVLKTDGNQALLLSDVALDDQRYNSVWEDVTWETGTIRSWLNGYGSSDNQQGEDYSGRNFIGSAFTSDERSAIADTSVTNTDNLSDGTEGGNDTVDKIFLLSESEVYGEGAMPYGFVSERDTYDEARRSKSSTYAKAMGVYYDTRDTYKDNCEWWLRSPGKSHDTAFVSISGYVHSHGHYVLSDNVGVRPALNLNLSSNQWTYAGTVCSDGTSSSGNGNEDGTAVTGIELISEEKLTLTVGDTSLVKCNVIPSNASNPAITWTSGDEKIAAVNEEGRIICVGAGSTVITAATVDGGFTKEVEVIVREKPSVSELRTPRTEADSSMEAKQKVTWDCVWFGSYPQSEVTSSDPIYKTLQDADGWDDNNDITIGGNRYRRMKKEDATYAATSSDGYYNWSDEDTYHYFKYEPVKWRVLKTDGNQALLLSDVVLDDQKYNTVWEDVTWETSTIRSWLNGYGSSDNQQGEDYSGRNFIGSAFISDERSAIADTSVTNADNLSSGTEGGNDTEDKIFLLSESEVYGEDAVPYGFVSEGDTHDEARRSKSSTYAKAMGVYSGTDDTDKDDCHWWLRSPAYYPKSAATVLSTSNVGGIHVDYFYVGVRPALNLNLSSNQWTYAGTVCSDGTSSSGNGNEDETAVTGIELLSEEKLTLTVGDTSLVKCNVIPSNASNPAITWTSGDEKIATVNEEGLITCAGAGSTVITAKTVDGGFTKEVEVIVREKPSVSELHTPRTEEAPGMEAKQKVTWDCVWFGSYPQSEVTSSDAIYRTLQDADGWDDNNDITIGGNRYRRMKKEDATYAATSSDGYYNWSDEDTYHYFKYEPVKWRVLKTDGNQALLLSDVALDDQRYNTVEEDVTWETSNIRSWLNGYGSSSNQQGTDYSGRNFIGSAFTSGERSAIADTLVVNADNLSFGTEGGNDTEDKIFLLSESEVYGEGAEPYGFVPDWNRYDEARRSKSSTYAKAMGVRNNTDDTYKDNCTWWLRSLGYDSRGITLVSHDGHLYRSGDTVVSYSYGVRPALNLNLSSNQWTYAGTVCSDGTSSSGNEDERPELHAPGTEADSSMTAKQKVTWDCVWFGNYPQSEVASSDPIYRILQNADGWDDTNDITIGRNRYRRMKKGDATYAAAASDKHYYNWPDADTYHYFKYEPVKWRVLKTDGNQALLLSDVTLDDQKYNTVRENVTWEASTIRSWLNGYGASDNQQGTDYSGRNFIDSTFTSDEQSAIADTPVVNVDNKSYGTEGGDDTEDKIFFLSESEVYGEGAEPYGFVPDWNRYDEARRSKSSTYAKAMGVRNNTDDTYKDNCSWWMRSPGNSSKCAALANYNGYVYYWSNVNCKYVGVRAALNLNLSSNQWTYAGTVCSDGTSSPVNENEDEIAVIGIELLSEEKLTLTVGDTSLAKCSVIPSDAANPVISWTAGDEKIATVNEDGLITCVGAGSTVITAKTADGGFTKEVEVIVREKPSADKEDLSKPAPPKTATLSSTSYVYNGKARKPSVTVKDSNGKTIGAGNYTVTYPAGCKNVGRYTVKITFKGSYTGSMKKSFKIKPRGTSISKVKAGKKSFTVKWKKQAKQTTGYQIQYSTNKKFKCGKHTVLVNKSKLTRRKITKLKAKKKYYVRIRTYKTVKINGKSQKIYSDWSKAKKAR